MIALLNGLTMGLREIWSHKFRSLLSLLGVILGVAALVGVFALVKGMFATWESFIQLTGGTRMVTVRPQKVPTEQISMASASPGLTYADAVALASCTLVENISPQVPLHGTLVRGSKTVPCEAFGCSEGIFRIQNLTLAHGRFISSMDVERASPVIAIGSFTAEQIFGPAESPIGKHVRFRDMTFEVVGVMQERYIGRHARHWMEYLNRRCFIPVTTAMRYFQGNQKLATLEFEAPDQTDVVAAVAQAESILNVTHRGVKDFQFQTREDQVQRFQENLARTQITGALIGGMTLLVGGIGIMNIMLASINERLREIGIRKAIGATNLDIFFQIIAETVTLATVGGLLGIAAAYGLVQILALLSPDSPPIIAGSSIIIGLVFSALTGVVFGLYPALRAAQLNPIEALRM